MWRGLTLQHTSTWLTQNVWLMNGRDELGPTSTLQPQGLVETPTPSAPSGMLGVATWCCAPNLICGDLRDSKPRAHQINPGGWISTSWSLVTHSYLTARNAPIAGLGRGGRASPVLPHGWSPPLTRGGGLADGRPPRAGAGYRGPAPGRGKLL